MRKFVSRYKWYFVATVCTVLGVAVYMNSCGGMTPTGMASLEASSVAAPGDANTFIHNVDPGSVSGVGSVTSNITVRPLGRTSQSAAKNLTVTTADGGDGIVNVTITAGADLPAGEGIFAQLAYDSSLSADSIDASLDGAQGLLAAAFPSGPGTLDLGVVAVKGSSVALKKGTTVASFKLGGAASTARGTSSAEVHAVGARARSLSLKNEAGEWVLYWDYTNPGDCNQDGEVGVGDLKNIGEHYKEVIDPFKSPLRHVDADANGEINMADVSSIGANLKATLWAYNIEMSQSGAEPFNTVGQLVLEDERGEGLPGQTVRFAYRFVGQYVPHAWYRVVPLVNAPAGGVDEGTPSESISDEGRQLIDVDFNTNATRTITVFAADLEKPIVHMTGCRVVFPDGYEYVKGSFNPGSIGGTREGSDGVWGTFATALLIAPESFMTTEKAANGSNCVDFNVTVVDKTAPAAPVSSGDLFNFQLKKVSGGPLSLSFEPGETSGVKRTYYADDKDQDVYFGNTIGFRVN